MQHLRCLGLSSRLPAGSAAFALTLLIVGMGSAQPAEAKTITIDPPGSNETLPVAINASNWIVPVNGSCASEASFRNLPQL